MFKAFTALGTDLFRTNDTISKVISTQATTLLPGPTPVTFYADGKLKGWKQVGGWPISRDTSTMWRAFVPAFGPVVGALVQLADTSRAEWFFRSGYTTQGPVVMKVKVGVVTGTGGVNPVTSVNDDTLKVVVSQDCGRTWRTLDSFNQARITAGQIDNSMRDFSYTIASSATPITVAFVVTTNGTPATEVYRWVLDDITFIASTDLAASVVSVPALRYPGCTRTNAEDIVVAVTNAGSVTLDTAVVGYIVDDEPAVEKLIIFLPRWLLALNG